MELRDDLLGGIALIIVLAVGLRCLGNVRNPAEEGCRLCMLRAMVIKVLTTLVWASMIVLALLFVVFATPVIFLIDDD